MNDGLLLISADALRVFYQAEASGTEPERFYITGGTRTT